jgi:CHASE3 domain sensor protein
VAESLICKEKVKSSLRKHTDELINVINEITDEENKALEEYAKAQDQMNESIKFFEAEN